MDLSGEKRGLFILHSAFCLGAVLMLFVLYYSNGPDKIRAIEFEMKLFVLFPLLFGVVCVLLSNHAFRTSMDRIQNNQVTKENLNLFRAAYISKWVPLLAPIFLNLIAYFFFYFNTLNLLMSIVLILLLYLSKPNYSHFIG